MCNLLRKAVFGLFTFLIASSSIHAGPLVTQLTLSNTASVNSAYPNGPFGSVTVEATSGNTVKITVATNPAIFDGTYSNFGIAAFGFNVDDSVTGAINPITTLPSGWGSAFDKNGDGFGKFDILAAGTGSNRVDPLVFSVTVANTLSADDLQNAFFVKNADDHAYSVHIAGYDEKKIGGTTSAWFTEGDGNNPFNTVPVPPAVFLMAIGGLGLMGARFRRRQKASD